MVGTFSTILLYTSFAFFSSNTDSVIYSDSTKTAITLKHLQGDWSNFDVKPKHHDCTSFIAEELPSTPFGLNDLVIKGDSIWMVRYPCQSYEKWHFQLKSDSIFVTERKGILAYVSIKNEDLIFEFPDCIIQRFKRDTFENKQMENLKRHKLNPQCFIQSLKMYTHAYTKKGAPYYKIHPLNMPIQLNITNDMAQTIAAEGTIELHVDGVLREFDVIHFSWGNHYDRIKPILRIRPGKWWTGKSFTAKYELE